jgi:hypothetical protein
LRSRSDKQMFAKSRFFTELFWLKEVNSVRKDNLILIVLTCMVMIGVISSVAAAARPEAIPPEYVRAASSRYLELYVDMDTAKFIVYDRRNDKVWRTSPEPHPDISVTDLWEGHINSNFVLHYVDEKKRNPRQTNPVSEKAIIDFEQIPNGVRVSYNMKAKLGIALALDFTLGDDYLEVTFPPETLQETGEFYLVALEVTPFFGAAWPDEEGYLFIPDGSGAIAHFREDFPDYSRGFNEVIYGEDKFKFQTPLEALLTHRSQVVMPVFGLAKTDKQAAYLGVVTKGEYNASILAGPAGYTVPLNRIGASFAVRRQYEAAIRLGTYVPTVEEQIIDRPMQVRYYLLANDDANYVGMATAYREHLIEEHNIQPRDEVRKPSLQLRIFGGLSRTEVLFREFIAMTTFEQTKTIVTALQEAGVDNIDVVFLGWNLYGYNGAYPKRLPVAKELGGSEGLTDLANFLSERGCRLFLEDNYLDADSDNGGFSNRRDIVREPNKLPMNLGGRYLLNPIYAWDRYAKPDLTTLSTLGVHGIQFRYLGKVILTDRNFDHPLTRQEFVSQWLKLSDYAREKMGAAIADGGNIYAINNVDAFTDVPIYQSTYDFVDKSIPFYQIVLHGFVPYSAYPGNLRSDPELEFLRMLEYGALPCFELTYQEPGLLQDTPYNLLFSSYYEQWLPKVVEEYNIVVKELGEIAGQYIVGHEYVLPNVVRVTYESGTSLLINYNADAVEWQGIIVDGMGYAIVEGGSEL